MTRPRVEPTTYRVRGGHANHLANPTRSKPYDTMIKEQMKPYNDINIYGDFKG